MVKKGSHVRVHTRHSKLGNKFDAGKKRVSSHVEIEFDWIKKRLRILLKGRTRHLIIASFLILGMLLILAKKLDDVLMADMSKRLRGHLIKKYPQYLTGRNI